MGPGRVFYKVIIPVRYRICVQPENLITLFFYGFLFILAACSPVLAGEIAVYGDSQLDQVAQERVVKAILQFKPSIILGWEILLTMATTPNSGRYLTVSLLLF